MTDAPLLQLGLVRLHGDADAVHRAAHAASLRERGEEHHHVVDDRVAPTGTRIPPRGSQHSSNFSTHSKLKTFFAPCCANDGETTDDYNADWCGLGVCYYIVSLWAMMVGLVAAPR